ncbi:MAG: TonB family protein [Proteobacteria bacterium]|nr:TonB family protein [Pseudomonadota bacterium]
MREKYLGTAISILVHTCVILPLMAASFTVQNRPVRLLEIDFSLMKYPSHSEGYVPKVEKGTIEKKPRILKAKKAQNKLVEPDQPVKQIPANIPVKEQVEPSPVPTIVTASDSQGEMVIHGTPATYAGSSGSGISLYSQGGSAGGTEGAEGGGWGTGKSGGIMLEEGKDYNYIRDAVMKNIEYPEWARRMGFEGKVLLSFIVLENGTTSQIRVVKSSGCRFLDDSAKEGVARTVISKKLPYRVVVRLPITYKLRVS